MLVAGAILSIVNAPNALSAGMYSALLSLGSISAVWFNSEDDLGIGKVFWPLLIASGVIGFIIVLRNSEIGNISGARANLLHLGFIIVLSVPISFLVTRKEIYQDSVKEK